MAIGECIEGSAWDDKAEEFVDCTPSAAEPAGPQKLPGPLGELGWTIFNGVTKDNTGQIRTGPSIDKARARAAAQTAAYQTSGLPLGVIRDRSFRSGFSMDGEQISVEEVRAMAAAADTSAAQAASASAAADRSFRTEERVGSELHTARENVLGRDFTRAEGVLGRDLSREELAAQQRFSADQSRLGRGLSAAAAFSGAEGDRATISLRASEAEANRRRGLVQDASANAMQLAQLISMTDPAAQLAFQEAGGGVISNAIASGANALSEGALLPGARTLRASDNIAALLAEPLSYERQPDFAPRKFLDPFTASEIYQPVLDGVPYVATAETPGLVDGDTVVVATPDGGPAAAAPAEAAPERQRARSAGDAVGSAEVSSIFGDLPGLSDQDLGVYAPAPRTDAARGAPVLPGLSDQDLGVYAPAPRTVDPGGVGAAALPTRTEVNLAEFERRSQRNIAEAARRSRSLTAEATAAAARRSLENPADVGLVDWQGVVSAAEGFTGRVTKPTTFVVAENGPEDVNITPVGQVRSQLPRTFGNEAIGGNVGDDEYMRRIRAIREGVEVQEPLGLNPFSTRFSKIAPSLRDRFFAARKTKFGIPLADQINEERQYRLRGVQRGAVQGV